MHLSHGGVDTRDTPTLTLVFLPFFLFNFTWMHEHSLAHVASHSQRSTHARSPGRHFLLRTDYLSHEIVWKNSEYLFTRYSG